MKKRPLGTTILDLRRHGTTTLFAAPNVFDGTVIGRNMKCHRNLDLIRFLKDH